MSDRAWARLVPLAFPAAFSAGCWEAGYRTELRQVESELAEHQTVARVQTWLAQQEAVAARYDRADWPEPVSELRPTGVTRADCGGISIALFRGDVVIVTVCPPGERPAPPFHEPSMAQPGYLGPYEDDAYIEIVEH